MNSSDELSSLKSELLQVEARIKADFRERNLEWLELASRAMLLIARMIVESSQWCERREVGRTVRVSNAALVPDLDPRAVNLEEFRTNTPEKLELLGGYLFDTAEHSDSRRRLLALLLVNVGLLEAVRLAPKEGWLEAFERVYGQ